MESAVEFLRDRLIEVQRGRTPPNFCRALDAPPLSFNQDLTRREGCVEPLSKGRVFSNMHVPPLQTRKFVMGEGYPELLLRLRVASKLLLTKEGVPPPAESHEQHCKHTGCWHCSKERKQFYFELVMLPSLCVLAVCVIIFATSVLIKGGAAVALWGVMRAITKHLTT